jgi:hypothetical protein
MKILWISKNVPLDSQVEGLKKCFGDDVEIHQDINPFSSAYDIIHRFKSGHYDEMVLIAPLSVCRIVTDMGYKPLYSEMVPGTREDHEIAVSGSGDRITGRMRYYKFVKFKRIERIRIVFSEL